MTPRVHNKRDGHPPDAVYVGRPTKWGNPFRLDDERDRATVLAKYEEWLHTQPELQAAMRIELRGKDLVCWCTPRACHADVIFRIANEEP